MGWLYNGGPVLFLERILALKSMQLLNYAPVEMYKQATEEQRKDGDICSSQISKTVMSLYTNLYRIGLRQEKDVSLETSFEAIISPDRLPFCASEVKWLKFGRKS